jgi:hypothetical protein
MWGGSRRSNVRSDRHGESHVDHGALLDHVSVDALSDDGEVKRRLVVGHLPVAIDGEDDLVGRLTLLRKKDDGMDTVHAVAADVP